MFSDFGYHGASTKLIAERVGIKQGSLYYYFTSKEAALEEVCLSGVGGFISGLGTIVATNWPVERKLRAAIENHLKPIVTRPDYVRTFINQRQYLPDVSRWSVGKQTRQYETLIAGIFEEGVKEEAFAPETDCQLAALGLLGECNGVISWFGRRAREYSIEEVAADLAGRILKGVAARP